MYPAIKSNAVAENEIRKQYGDALIDKLLAINAQPSNRLIDGDCDEWSASIEADNGDIIEVLYLIYGEERDLEDMSNADWSNYTFLIS